MPCGSSGQFPHPVSRSSKRQWPTSSPNSPARVDTANTTRGPLLITAGTADHTVPRVSVKATFKLYEKSAAVTDFHEFDGAGHSLTIDHRWREVADVVLTWLAGNGFTGEGTG